eukprot:gnl/Hemi2/20377_TR6763_c0_g1_i2.p1 gnl/Hemi2/20377_TR6763_c0_g1~~gnl/Hemi2/20377_TR6763_c0_g1_i2.p1  ORF type:complete len:190 (+),score=50.85 gnl/Hemi2/20377_TR6763_c0_g1_i2:66-635(+)
MSGEGAWGPVTATIDWCEHNYAISRHVAEFFNTSSNAALILCGLAGLRVCHANRFEMRFYLQYLGIICIGVGSALFHATLGLVAQQLDETPMIWSLLVWAFVVYDADVRAVLLPRAPTLLALVPALLTMYGVVFSVLHFWYRFTSVFQIHFAAWVGVCLVRFYTHLRSTKDPDATRVGGSTCARLCWRR